MCSICKLKGYLAKATPSVCKKCYKTTKIICNICKQYNNIYQKTNNGGICKKCRIIKKNLCTLCERIKIPAKRADGIICKSCYAKQHKGTCGICNKYKRIYKNNPIICVNCFKKNRRNNDEIFRIKENIKNRTRMAINSYNNGIKVISVSKDIDYKKIYKHIGPCPCDKNQYHIDHILPLIAFDFNNPTYIKAAFAPENHQWLKAEANLKKSNKYNKKDFDNYISKFMENK